MSRHSRLAKLSAPRTARVLLRPRLFRKLDQARQRRVLWVVAPPGAGKTALLATWLQSRKLCHLWVQLDEADSDVATFFHYLARAAEKPALGRNRLPAFTHEFLAAPGGFARLFLRALCTRSRWPAVIVLDDYHEVRSDSPLHGALRDGFSELPHGVTAMVLSRSEPPAVFVRMHANDQLRVLRGDELALTEREARAIAGLWGYSGRNRDMLHALYVRSEGWAVGLVLLLAGWRSSASERRRDGDEQALFDYFAKEVLEHLDPETQRVLLETALLPSIEGAMAVRLTGAERAEEILADLSRRGCFVARYGASYQYHALFREFLLRRAAEALSPERRVQIQRSAADLLEGSGRAEDAFPYYVQAGAWTEAARIVRSHAPRLMGEGRAETLAGWIRSFPEEIRDSDPWLLLHLGETWAVLDPCQALGHLERAFELFYACGNGPGAYLAWSVIAEPIIYGLTRDWPLDRWIAALEDLRVRFPDLGGPEVEARLVGAAFLALAHNQPWLPSLPSWEKWALALVLGSGHPHLRIKVGRHLLTHYSAFVVDLDKARLVAEALRPYAAEAQREPITAINWHLADAVFQIHRGNARGCRAAADRGLSISTETRMHTLDGYLLQQRIFAAFHEGDLAAAERDLQRLEEVSQSGSLSDATVFHHCALLLARREGDARQIRDQLRICRGLADAFCSVQARILFGASCACAESPDAIEPELEKLLAEARRCNSRHAQAAALLALALVAARRGDEGRAVKLLREGVALARDLGCLFFVSLIPAELAECCALALEHGIETEYVQELIRSHRLPPGERAQELETWPWELRIDALGELVVIRNGERVRSARKEQKKPLEMLRLLVAQCDRGMRQDLLAEALWPDAEGDAAHHALKTTMYRLRRFLGKTEAIMHQDGRVALDPRFVFVDAWALERLLDRIEAALKHKAADAASVDALRARVNALYRGDLFGAGEDEPTIMAVAKRLRGRVELCLHAS